MRLRAAGLVIACAGFVAACNPTQPVPRTSFDFMEDGLAREGVLARCNQDRDATRSDVECSNARRAATLVALEQERARSEELARESERKLLAMRKRAGREAIAEQNAAEAVRAATEAAYQARWPGPAASQDAATTDAGAVDEVPSFGAPLGPVLPSISDSAPVYAEDAQPPQRPNFEAAVVEPPVVEVQIERPAIGPEEVAIIPRPFRSGDDAAASR